MGKTRIPKPLPFKVDKASRVGGEQPLTTTLVKQGKLERLSDGKLSKPDLLVTRKAHKDGFKDLLSEGVARSTHDVARTSPMLRRLLGFQAGGAHPTMDQTEARQGLAFDYNYKRQKEWEASFKQQFNRDKIDTYFATRYEVFPGSHNILPERIFAYRREGTFKSFELAIAATLKLCKIPESHQEFADFEAILEAEREMGENPKLLRDILIKERVPDEVYRFFAQRTPYIWKVER